MRKSFYSLLIFSLCAFASSIDDEIINDIEFFSMMEYLEEEKKSDIDFEDMDLIANEDDSLKLKKSGELKDEE
jgi:hypothetical protein